MEEVKTAVERAFGEVISVEWQWGPEVRLNDGYRADIVATLMVGKKAQRILIEYKARGEPNVIAQVAGYSRLLPDGAYLIFVAPYVSERGRKVCKELGLGFVDLEGNAYIHFDTVLIERYGRSGPQREKRILKRLFSTRSTWVIRKMLAEPEREWVTNELAEEARVSLGTVYKVTERLEAEGYLEKRWGAIRLISPGDLLDAWREKYDMMDQDVTGYYSPVKDREPFYERLRRSEVTDYALTLGAASNLVAPFVRSTDNHIYSSSFEEMEKVLELEPVEFGGNVYLIKPSDDGVLFDTQIVDGVRIVSNIQLYLDLYNYPARGKEQAEFLRERLLEM